ncbi:hypothetical protein RUM43_000618 [Polyplax serrata]|uniref:Uncharacterized protein n=1 Tax=Polyplax serrata TaxID=468196 RepID=A0AAN8XQQ1_POLSC
MNLNDPGTSLFQGNELNQFDNLAQQEEEQEALEDQRRRDLELKNMLENAFDDVSFENEEESLCNGSPSHSSINHSLYNSNSSNEYHKNGVKKINCNGLNDFDKNEPNNIIENLSVPITHSRTSLIKRVDFNNDGENYSDRCRKKVQNGNLHDVVDASGGGGTVQSTHYNHCFQRSPISEIPNGLPNNNCDFGKKSQLKEEAFDSGEQLKILYDVRVREVHRLTEMIDSIRKEHEIGISKLKHQVALSQAEIESLKISQTQLQNLLVTKNQNLEDLEKQLADLERENTNLKSSNGELLNQLDLNKLIVADLERKVLVLEKGNKITSEAVQYESSIKALVEKHSFELMSLNFEQEKLTKDNNELMKENTELKLKINQMNELHDENLSKKSEIISRLSKQIDESQKQCENLMKSASAEDNIRLQMELKLLKEEKLFLTSKLESMQMENSRQDEELKQYESINKLMSFSSFSELKDEDCSNMNGKLSDELYKALNGQKAKRQEIKRLQLELEEKTKTINLLQGNEKLLNDEINNLKDNVVVSQLTQIKQMEVLISDKETENVVLQNRLENLKEEFEIAQRDLQIKISELENINKVLKDTLASAEKEQVNAKSSLNEEYLRFHDESIQQVREEAGKFFKLEILKKNLENENLKKEVEQLKNLYVDVFSSKEALLKQLEKEKNSSGRSSAVDVDEVKRLQKELDKSRHRILELDQTLKQQYEQEVDILNLDINQLNLQVEKLKKEKDREVSEKDKILVENELLKSEIEHITSEKNLLFLNYEKVQKELKETCRSVQDTDEGKVTELKAKYETEIRNLTDKYEIIVKKLKKEIELTLTKAVKCESKYTSPMKSVTKTIECQWSPPSCDNSAITSKTRFKDMCTSPVSHFRTSATTEERRKSVRNISIATEPELNSISRKEVIEIMEKLGVHHENEMRSLESKYRAELSKLDKKFQVELDKARDIIRTELEKDHAKELEQMEEKYKIELENRVEQEKKEAVADLITEWACEVQGLKASYAEAQTEMERMKMKYKAAKSVALQYKTYFKGKTEYMQEEWKKIEDGYEQALKELEKNVHILVDVKEDEVKAKVDSITKVYEQKISKMKEKLLRCENRLKSKKPLEVIRKPSKVTDELAEMELRGSLERLKLPEVNLCLSSPSLTPKGKGKELKQEYKRKKAS